LESFVFGGEVEKATDVGVKGVRRPGLWDNVSKEVRIEESSGERVEVSFLNVEESGARLIEIASSPFGGSWRTGGRGGGWMEDADSVAVGVAVNDRRIEVLFRK